MCFCTFVCVKIRLQTFQFKRKFPGVIPDPVADQPDHGLQKELPESHLGFGDFSEPEGLQNPPAKDLSSK